VNSFTKSQWSEPFKKIPWSEPFKKSPRRNPCDKTTKTNAYGFGPDNHQPLWWLSNGIWDPTPNWDPEPEAWSRSRHPQLLYLLIFSLNIFFFSLFKPALFSHYNNVELETPFLRKTSFRSRVYHQIVPYLHLIPVPSCKDAASCFVLIGSALQSINFTLPDT